MKLHTHVVDYKHDRPKGKQPILHRKLAWWIYDSHEGEQTHAEGHAEVRIGKPRDISFRFHAGNEGSETPFDAHASVFGVAVYGGIRIGKWTGKLAKRLTHPRGEQHEWEGRDLSLRISDGSIWINAWTHDNRWTRGEFAAWRYGSHSINPLDYIHGGPKRYSYTDVDTADIVLELHDDSYPVRLKLQRRRFGRPRGPVEEGWSVDWSARQGIPTHFDHSGGWKGDRTYGSGFDIDRADDWVNEATAKLRAWVYDYRARTGFRQADPIDDAA